MLESQSIKYNSIQGSITVPEPGSNTAKFAIEPQEKNLVEKQHQAYHSQARMLPTQFQAVIQNAKDAKGGTGAGRNTPNLIKDQATALTYKMVRPTQFLADPS